MANLPQPKEGDVITVELPDERTRATVKSVVSPVMVLAVIGQHTTAQKSHAYRKGDTIPCQYRDGAMNQRMWHVVSQKEFEEAEDRLKTHRKGGKEKRNAIAAR